MKLFGRKNRTIANLVAEVRRYKPVAEAILVVEVSLADDTVHELVRLTLEEYYHVGRYTGYDMYLVTKFGGRLPYAPADWIAGPVRIRLERTE